MRLFRPKCTSLRAPASLVLTHKSVAILQADSRLSISFTLVQAGEGQACIGCYIADRKVCEKHCLVLLQQLL